MNRKSERILRPDLSLFIPIYRNLSGFHRDCRDLQFITTAFLGDWFVSGQKKQMERRRLEDEITALRDEVDGIMKQIDDLQRKEAGS